MTWTHTDIQIPAKFWKSLTDAEFHQVCMTSELSPELCARAWRMLDRQDEPPEKLGIMVSREDVMRLFPAPPPRKKKAKV
jgi:hypothetical protein